MSERAKARAVAAVAILGLANGCYKNLPFNNYWLELPQVGSVGELRVGGRAVVRFEDLSVKVDALKLGAMSTLLVLVFASGEGQYTFNPMEVALITGDGPSRQPAWYLGPGRLRRLYRDDRACLPLTNGPTRSQEWFGKSADGLPQLTRRAEAAQHILVASDTCFVLLYQAPVAADAEIAFNGIRRDGADVRGVKLLVGDPVYGSVLSVREIP